MTNDGHSSLKRNRKVMLYASALAVLVAASACQRGSVTTESDARGVIIVNAPAAGVVRRVLAREGMTVS